MPVDVLGIDHIYVTVRDLAAAEAFYDCVLVAYATFFTGPDGIRLEITGFRASRRQRMNHWDPPS